MLLSKNDRLAKLSMYAWLGFLVLPHVKVGTIFLPLCLHKHAKPTRYLDTVVVTG